jgi:hypothetical protein
MVEASVRKLSECPAGVPHGLVREGHRGVQATVIKAPPLDRRQRRSKWRRGRRPGGLDWQDWRPAASVARFRAARRRYPLA